MTTIRYELNSVSDVTIDIYDLAGEKIDELIGTGLASTPNEVVWNIDGIESGVYLARIQATSNENSSTAEKIIKIAVMK